MCVHVQWLFCWQDFSVIDRTRRVLIAVTLLGKHIVRYIIMRRRLQDSGTLSTLVVNLIFDVVTPMYALVCRCYRPAACAVLALSKTLAMEAADAECHQLVILEANLGDFGWWNCR